MTSKTLWIGTSAAPGTEPGSGEGIWQVAVDGSGRFGEPRLVVQTPSPTFVALHPSGRTLYAVAEGGEGAVVAFTVSDDGAALSDPVTVSSGGSSPCHVLALDDALWVANYGDGVASVFPLDPQTGAFSADRPTSFEGSGNGPREDRQEGPHAHFTGVVGETALVSDLGADLLRAYPAHPADVETPRPARSAAELPPGTGPRHFAELPGGALLVTGELDGNLHVLAPAGPGTWTPASATPSTVGDHDLRQLSHVTVTSTATGDLVLVGVRGADVLTAHRVGPGAATVGAVVGTHESAPAAPAPAAAPAAAGSAVVPSVEPLADIPLGDGAWPRHHAVLGKGEDGRLLVVVARERTSDLAAVLLDPETGEGAVVGSLTFPTPPMCVLEAS